MPLLPFEKGECCNSSMGANRAPRKDLSQSRNSLGYPWAFSFYSDRLLGPDINLQFSATPSKSRSNLPRSDSYCISNQHAPARPYQHRVPLFYWDVKLDGLWRSRRFCPQPTGGFLVT